MARSRLGAAMLAAVLWLSGLRGGLCAETLAEPFDAPDRVLLFSGVELARSGGLLYGGFVWSPEGLNAEGLAIKVLTAAGTYRYRSGEAAIIGGHTLVSALPGWRLKRQHFEATIYGGLDLQSHVFVPDDPNNPMRGHSGGLRLAVDRELQLRRGRQPHRRRHVHVRVGLQRRRCLGHRMEHGLIHRQAV